MIHILHNVGVLTEQMYFYMYTDFNTLAVINRDFDNIKYRKQHCTYHTFLRNCVSNYTIVFNITK